MFITKSSSDEGSTAGACEHGNFRVFQNVNLACWETASLRRFCFIELVDKFEVIQQISYSFASSRKKKLYCLVQYNIPPASSLYSWSYWQYCWMLIYSLQSNIFFISWISTCMSFPKWYCSMSFSSLNLVMNSSCIFQSILQEQQNYKPSRNTSELQVHMNL